MTLKELINSLEHIREKYGDNLKVVTDDFKNDEAYYYYDYNSSPTLVITTKDNHYDYLFVAYPYPIDNIILKENEQLVIQLI